MFNLIYYLLTNNAFQILVTLNKSGEEEVLLAKEHECVGEYLIMIKHNTVYNAWFLFYYLKSLDIGNLSNLYDYTKYAILNRSNIPDKDFVYPFSTHLKQGKNEKRFVKKKPFWKILLVGVFQG